MNIPDIIFTAGLDRALGWTVVHALWQITLVAFITGILLLLMRNKSAQARYWVTNAALLSVFLMSAATFAWYADSDMAATTEPVAAPAVIVNPEAAATAMLQQQQAGQATLHPAKVATNSFGDYFNRHFPLIVLMWLAGMVVFLLRLLGSLLQVYDMKLRMNFHADPYWSDLLNRLVEKSGLRQGITLMESALVRSPLTIGHLRPLILFPIGMINRLSEQEVEAILAHELAHILRRDYLFNILQSLIEALFYFHPAIWWLSAQVRKEREHACDDKAIALLGDKLNYAKALVSIQEMAFYPQSPALAFAGSRKGQLLQRVQRLFSQPKTSFNIMEKWITTVLVVCTVFVLALGQRLNNNTDNQQSSEHNTGLWEATFTKDSVLLTLTSRSSEGHWSMGEDFPKSSFTNLNVINGETTFDMTRPAGKMVFNGKIEGTGGYGRYSFTPDENYRTALGQQNIKVVDDQLLLMCFFAGFPSDYVKNLEKIGFKDINKDRLQQLAAFRLTEKEIKSYRELAAELGDKELSFDNLMQMKVANVTSGKVASLLQTGCKDIKLDDAIQLSLHQVEPAYIEEMNKAGLGKLSNEELLSAKIHGIDANFVTQAKGLNLGEMNLDKVMSLKVHNVDPVFISQMQNLGLGKLGFDEIMNLKVHNIDPEFVKQAQNMGLGNLGLEEIMNLRIFNIDAEYIKQVEKMNLGKLSFDEIRDLKIHNIDESFIRDVQNTGLGKLSMEQIRDMKIHNIDGDFVKQAQNMGLGNLSFDEIRDLRIHNIDPEFVKQTQKLGLGKLDFDQILNLRIHNIDPEFIKQAQGMKLGELKFDDLMNLRIHNITPEFAKSFRDLHFDKLTMDDLLTARIHGVTPAFIEEANKKGYKMPSLSDYIELKLRMDRRGDK